MTAENAMKRLQGLPLKVSLGIALKSLQVRFFRSLITTLSLVLAVAFLSFTHISDDSAEGLLTLNSPEFQTQLSNLGYDISPGAQSLSASPKQRWIVMLSLLVCVVGIVNAQLMSVTERFREIGTMKCLGALDSFVVKIFIIEASLQGFVGSVFGTLLGGIAALSLGLLRFGPAIFAPLSWMAVLQSMATAVLIGTILSLLGALYPALVAARMQPVEAMRVEQ